jgi:outer membrane murein-binding lipoprotein Lpp
MDFAPSTSPYRERDFVSIPEGATPRPSNIQNSPKPRHIQSNQRRLSIGRRMSRAFVRCAIMLLIGVGATLAWQSYSDEAIEVLRKEAPSLAGLLPASKAKPPAELQASAAAVVTSAELGEQFNSLGIDLAKMRQSVEQLATKVEQLGVKVDQLSHSMVLQSLDKLSSPPQPRVATPRKPTQPTAQ